MKAIIFTWLAGLCIAQIIHWYNFRIPVFGLLFIPPLIAFCRRAVEEAHDWVMLHTEGV